MFERESVKRITIENKMAAAAEVVTLNENVCEQGRDVESIEKCENENNNEEQDVAIKNKMKRLETP